MLRDYYKAEYKKALQEKVEHQRKNIQERQNKLEEQAKISQEHEVCSSHFKLTKDTCPSLIHLHFTCKYILFYLSLKHNIR